MSTPSPEAKQAAEKLEKQVEACVSMRWEPQHGDMHEAVRQLLETGLQEFVDTATAKLRVALNILARGKWPDPMTQAEVDLVNEQLAHQQPSAITSELVLAQAREPLVIVKKNWPTVIRALRGDITASEAVEAVMVISAALTGTKD